MKKNNGSNQMRTIYTQGLTAVAATGNKMALASAAAALLLLASSASAQVGRMGTHASMSATTRQPSGMTSRTTSSGAGMKVHNQSNFVNKQQSSAVRNPLGAGGRVSRNAVGNRNPIGNRKQIGNREAFRGFRNHGQFTNSFTQGGQDGFGWMDGGAYLAPEPVEAGVAVGYPVTTDAAPAAAPVNPEPVYTGAPCGCQPAPAVAPAYTVYPAPMAATAVVGVPMAPLAVGFGWYRGVRVGGPYRHYPVRRFGRR